MFSWAHRRGLILRNPFHLDFVAPYEVGSAERFFEDHEVAQIGEVIRYGEQLHEKGCTGRDRVPVLQALHALRIAIYTGCRQRVELVHGQLDWLKGVPGPLPRLEIPRAKGQRGGKRGRYLYLGPHATELLVNMYRPRGSEHLLIPGRDTGKPLYSLGHVWDWVAKHSGIKDASPKAWRHTARTNHVRCGIAEEHSAQLLGHRGRPITDTVYLHRHGPSLVQAATTYEIFIRRLLGDLPAERHGLAIQGGRGAG